MKCEENKPKSINAQSKYEVLAGFYGIAPFHGVFKIILIIEKS